MEIKMLRYKKFQAAAAVCLFAAGVSGVTVQAASVSSVQGPVYLSRAGGPFEALKGSTHVQAGDIVRAEAGSSAQIIYADGVVAAVADGGSLTVAAEPAAVLTGRASQGAPESGSEVAGNGANAALLVAGGLAVAGGGLLLAKKLSDDKKNKSASP
jgi:hypothetical protein